MSNRQMEPAGTGRYSLMGTRGGVGGGEGVGELSSDVSEGGGAGGEAGGWMGCGLGGGTGCTHSRCNGEGGGPIYFDRIANAVGHGLCGVGGAGGGGAGDKEGATVCRNSRDADGKCTGCLGVSVGGGGGDACGGGGDETIGGNGVGGGGRSMRKRCSPAGGGGRRLWCCLCVRWSFRDSILKDDGTSLPCVTAVSIG